MRHPRQPELDLGPEAPPREMVVAGPDLARTIGELRAAGYEVASMDVKGATYWLHVRRAPAPPRWEPYLSSPGRGYARDRSLFVTPPKTKFPLSFPLSAFDL